MAVERERFFDFMWFVKLQPCLLRELGDCEGAIQADHAGLDRGLSQKADDRTCIPMCDKHHRDRTESRGFFFAMTPEQRVDWRLQKIMQMQARYSRWVSYTGDMVF
jgi:hypothetical protein